MPPAIEERVSMLEADSLNFKQWQKSQDAAIRETRECVATTDSKFDSKFDKLMFLLIAQLCGVLLTLVTLWGGKH